MLNKDELLTLWEQGGHFRDVVACEIVANFATHHDLFFDLLDREGAEALVCAAKAAFMFFLIPITADDIDCRNSECAIFDEHRLDEKLFFDALAARYRSLSGDDADGFMATLLWAFPEIEPQILEACGLPVPPQAEPPYNRELMIFVTGRCNLQCPYCFSSDIDQSEISREDLSRLVAWAKSQGVAAITPCGGEPLLYRHLDAFLDEIEAAGMHTYFASNLTVDITRFKKLARPLVHQIFAHATAQTLSSPRLLEIFRNNIVEALGRGIDVVGRVNLTSADASSLYGAMELFRELGVSQVNVALTIPSTNATNSYTTVEEFDKRIPALCALLVYAGSLGLKASIAKPLPVCRFPREMLPMLMDREHSASRCAIHEAHCTHNISLSPTMEFSPCLGLENVRVKFDDNLTWAELRERFEPYVTGLLRQPLYDNCEGCYLWRKRLCQGSCLSYKIASPKTC